MEKGRVQYHVAKIKHYSRRENKANKRQGRIILQDIKIFANTYAQKEIKTKKVFSVMSSLQSNCHFKLIHVQNVCQPTGGQWLIHGTKRHKDN